jgi:hypothetical protein
MSKRRVVLFVFLALVMALSACASASRSMQESAPAEPGMPPTYNKGMKIEMPITEEHAVMDAAGSGSNAGVAGYALPEQRLVLRNANLTIVVADPAKAMSAIGALAEGMEGYIVNSNLYKTGGVDGAEFPEANITVRVPSGRLTEALSNIKGMVKDPSKDVRSENVSGQDVTKEYTDLKSRLRNLEDTEKQLREIMGSATKTEDVLSVYNQLVMIREQIEVMKGQIQYFEESAALSSIAVQIMAEAAVQPLEIGGWQPVGVARDAVQALIDTVQFLASAAIWVALFALPVALLIFLPLRGLWVLFRRSRRGKVASAPPPSA